MKRQSVMKACIFGILLSMALPSLADEQSRKLADTLTKLTNLTLAGQGPGWLKRTSVSFGMAGQRPEWTIKTLQPVVQNRDENLFLQGRLRREDERAVANAGSVYRWRVPGDGVVLGLNGFYDRGTPSNAERISIGGEVFAEDLSLRANLYSRLGGLGGRPEGDSPFALDGFDLKFEAPAPLLSRTRWSLKTYQWDVENETGAVRGWSAALKANPDRKLSLEFGAGRTPRDETELFLNLNYRFGQRVERKPAVLDQLAPRVTRIERDFTMLAGNG